MTPRNTRVSITLGVALTAAVLVGCGTPTTPEAPPGSASAAGTSSAPNPAPPGSGSTTIDPAATQQLCSAIEEQFQAFRTYGPTVGKGTLNAVVADWAGRNGIDVVDLAQHRERIDTITTEVCPHIRTEALDYLSLPNFAAGLIGF